VRFGFATDTYDAEGEPTGTPETVNLRAEDVEAVAARFQGVFEQTPPAFSAKKIDGVPAYKLARQQKQVSLKPVQVEIKEFVILEVELDRARFRARVASGTYMRSVAHEMGRELACGAHLESLRRTSVAEFNLADSHTLEEVANAVARNGLNSLDDLFIHPRKLLPQFPSVTADEAAVLRIRSGRTVNLPELSRARQVKVFSGQKELIAIAVRVAGTLFHPKIVLCGMEASVRL
jgi:tRNA pseudouridine55 synthase